MELSEASAFLHRATFGPTRSTVESLCSQGVDSWLTSQSRLNAGTSHVRWLLDNGYSSKRYVTDRTAYSDSIWSKWLFCDAQLRCRVAYALSQIIVVSVSGLTSSWPSFLIAHYFDVLESHAFGNYRKLLSEVANTPAMSIFLSFRGSRVRKSEADPQPDENFSRELMQLFTIGTRHLGPGNTMRGIDERKSDTYTQSDVKELARVFTGWQLNHDGTNYPETPLATYSSLVANEKFHDSRRKIVLGTEIPAGQSAQRDREDAMDILYAHPNVARFVSRRLIQNLVSSDPSEAYVERVSVVFDRERESSTQLFHVVVAVLTDEEVVDLNGAARKIREPILKFSSWARAFCEVASENPGIGNTSDPAFRLGQMPGNAPTVFGFYSPDNRLPDKGKGGRLGRFSPEFGLVNSTTTVGYLDFMYRVVRNGIGDIRPDYALLPGYDDKSPEIVDYLSLFMVAGRLSKVRVRKLKSLLARHSRLGDKQYRRGVQMVVYLICCSPEYQIQS